MRVLFACRPAYGHLNPLLPLAIACRDAGHDVTFGTGDEALPRVRDLGFRAERVGIAIDAADELAFSEIPELAELPREERWKIGVVVFGDVLPRRTLADILPLLDDLAPDLVVYDETDIGAAAAASAVGVRAVAHSLGRQLPDPIRRAVFERVTRIVGDLELEGVPLICSSRTRTTTSAGPGCRTPPRRSPASGSRPGRSCRSGRAMSYPAGSAPLARVRSPTSRSAPTSRGTSSRCALR